MNELFIHIANNSIYHALSDTVIMLNCPFILPQVKPLALTFINDTPRVSKYTIMASFRANRKSVEMTCYLTRLNEKHNCKLYIDVEWN